MTIQSVAVRAKPSLRPARRYLVVPEQAIARQM